MNQRITTPVSSAWLNMAQKVAAQQWLPSTLYVVATPIGNLGDLSLRAWQILARVEVIAAEDTRVSQVLLQAWGIQTPLIAAHRHNEALAAQAICERLKQKECVALISDAGAPGISDPGGRIVHVVRMAGYSVQAIPGPSALITALMASGVTTDANPAFVFAGFAPHKAGARLRWLKYWCLLSAPIVMFEAPHRLAHTIKDSLTVCGSNRTITIARELTKRFEEIITLTLGEASAWLALKTQGVQGEFVLIIHPAESSDEQENETLIQADKLLHALLESLSVRDATRVAARVTGLARDSLYERALRYKEAFKKS